MGLSRDSIEHRIQRSVPLAPYTTFHIGGPASYFIQPESTEQLGSAIEWALERDTPYFILGGGANILVHDRGFDGLVIHTEKLTATAVKGHSMHTECGLSVDRLVDKAADHGLSGLEFAAGLPGTVGGALFMNARAYEGEFSTVVSSVNALQIRGKTARPILLHPDDLHFSYKKSVFQGGQYCVCSVHFLLAPGDKKRIQSQCKHIRQKRREAGQFTFPNAGCIFKNNYDTGKATGRIIDELGLKGTRIGDAEVYRMHGNFIINHGSASSEDVYRLIQLLESRIEEHLGVRIEREISLIGPWETQ